MWAVRQPDRGFSLDIRYEMFQDLADPPWSNLKQRMINDGEAETGAAGDKFQASFHRVECCS